MTALACLERARLLGPFEWTASFNLGLVHLHMGHNVAAYTSFSAAIKLQASFAQSYMLLGIALGRLDELDNACHAFQRAIDLEPDNALFRLNCGTRAQKHACVHGNDACTMTFLIWSTWTLVQPQHQGTPRCVMPFHTTQCCHSAFSLQSISQVMVVSFLCILYRTHTESTALKHC